MGFGRARANVCVSTAFAFLTFQPTDVLRQVGSDLAGPSFIIKLDLLFEELGEDRVLVDRILNE